MPQELREPSSSLPEALERLESPGYGKALMGSHLGFT